MKLLNDYNDIDVMKNSWLFQDHFTYAGRMFCPSVSSIVYGSWNRPILDDKTTQIQNKTTLTGSLVKLLYYCSRIIAHTSCACYEHQFNKYI